MYHSKKIGVFISHIFGHFQTGLCQGIIDKASEYGYTVEIFASLDGENLGSYSSGEDSLLRIPGFDRFCAVIFASGTYLSGSLREKIRAALTENCRCPILEVNPEENSPDGSGTLFENGSFPCVMLENHQPFARLVSHFIEEHRFRKICYLGYRTAPEYNRKRKEACCSVTKAHNLELRTLDCDGSEEEIRTALSFFLDAAEPSHASGPSYVSGSSHDPAVTGRPDAIVCYNDSIALHLMQAIMERGLHVPDDIAVTGCDHLEIGQEINPRLTTVSFPVYEAGTACVELLIKTFSGQPLPPCTVIQAEPVYAASCGCPQAKVRNSYFLTHRLLNQISASEQDLFEDMKMSACLHGVADIDEGMDLLEQYASQIKNCRELYLCLYPDWDRVSNPILELALGETDEPEDHGSLLLKFAMKKKERLPECTFLGQSTLPEFLYGDFAHAYLYFPLYFADKAFGYLVLSYEDGKIDFPFRFVSWIKNVNSMLKNICDTKHLHLLNNRLEELYTKDELTGLLNRQGFFLRSGQLLLERMQTPLSPAAAADPLYAAVAVDVDCLHVINSSFGHEEGNFALLVTGHALENAVGEQGICARINQDKFYVLAPVQDETAAQKLTDRIHSYLEHYNVLQTRKYNVSVSTGFFLASPKSVSDIETMFEKAAILMQQEKQKEAQKEKQILK